jgi:hypothetical protein
MRGSLAVAICFLALPWGFFEIYYAGLSILDPWVGIVIMGFWGSICTLLKSRNTSMSSVAMCVILILVAGLRLVFTADWSLAKDTVILCLVLALFAFGTFHPLTAILDNKRALIFLVGVDLAFWVFTYMSGSSASGILGEQIARGEAVEYQDIFSSVLFLAALDHFFREKIEVNYSALTLALVVTVITGSRIYEAALVISIIIKIVLLLKIKISGGRINLVSALTAVMFVLLAAVGCDDLRFAIHPIESVCTDLAGRWFEPVAQGANPSGIVDWIFGVGADAQFYIPWFEYRGLEVMASSIDSALIYTSVKQGVLYTLVLMLLVLWHTMGTRVSRWWLPFLFITHNVFLSPNFILLLLVAKRSTSKPRLS